MAGRRTNADIPKSINLRSAMIMRAEALRGDKIRKTSSEVARTLRKSYDFIACACKGCSQKRVDSQAHADGPAKMQATESKLLETTIRRNPRRWMVKPRARVYLMMREGDRNAKTNDTLMFCRYCCEGGFNRTSERLHRRAENKNRGWYAFGGPCQNLPSMHPRCGHCIVPPQLGLSWRKPRHQCDRSVPQDSHGRLDAERAVDPDHTSTIGE